MSKFLQAVKKYFKNEEERALYQFGLVILFIGLGISNSVIEISKGFIIIAFIISLIRKKIKRNPLKDPLFIAVSTLFAWVFLANLLQFTTPYFIDSFVKRNPWHVYGLFVSSYFLFNFQKDKHLVIFLFLSLTLNSFVVLPIFFTTFARTGGFWGVERVMSCATSWPLFTYLNLGIIFYLKNKRAKIIWSIIFLITLTTLIAFQSSITFVIVPLLLVSLFVLYVPPKAGTISVFITLFSIMLAIFLFQNKLLPNKVQNRLTTVVRTRPQGMKERSLFWKGSLEIIKEHPIIGIGSGNWENYMYDTEAGKEYAKLGYSKRYFHAHNNFIQEAAAHGIPALILQIVMFAFVLGKGYLILSKNGTHDLYPILLAIYFGFISFLLQGITDFTLFGTTAGSFYWILVGVFFGFAEKVKTESV